MENGKQETGKQNAGKKIIATGVGLFLLGGLSVYLLMAPQSGSSEKKLAAPKHSAMQAAIAQMEQQKPAEEKEAAPTATQELADDGVPEMTHAAFLAEAEARREQGMENKAEIERLEKLKKAKLNSVECKFWRQQQKTSSAAAKIDEKINQFCYLPPSSSSSSAAQDEQAASELTENQNYKP